MLKFFNLLPEGAREEILKNLCRNAELNKDSEEDFVVDMKSAVKDYRLAMEDKSEGEKASLYDDYIEAQCKQALTKKYGKKIPCHQLQSGLQITLASCSNKDLGKVKSFSVSKIAGMIRSLARKLGTKLLNHLRKKSLRAISAVCLHVLIPLNTTLQQMLSPGKLSSRAFDDFVPNMI